MGTPKRQRQRAARQAKLEAELTDAKKQKAKHTGIKLAIGAAIVLALLFGYSLLTRDSGDDDSSGAAETTTTTLGDEPADDEATTGTGEFAYGTTPCPPAAGTAEPVLEFESSFEQCVDSAKTYTATFATTEGDVVVELDVERTPGTANNFVALSRSGYYDGTQLFRTDPSIGIIQGGSPHTNDPSDPGPGYTLPDEGGEFDWSGPQGKGPFSYEPGQIVMARSAGPDAAGAQFFLTVDDAVKALDGQGTYVVFGQVTEGLDVLESIMGLHEDDPTSPLGGGPSRDVTVESIEITEA